MTAIMLISAGALLSPSVSYIGAHLPETPTYVPPETSVVPHRWLRCRFSTAGSSHWKEMWPSAKGVVFKGDVMVKNAGCGLHGGRPECFLRDPAGNRAR